MQAKMIMKGGADKHRDLETVGSDTLDYITRDVNEHRYGSLWIVLKTQFAVLKMLRHKTAAATAKAFSSAKAEIEALTDPGGKAAYKIQRVGRDPGSEYLGEFLDVAAEHNIPRETGAVNIHKNQSIQENRHKMNQRTGTAITAHCCENEQTGDLLHGNAGVWACTLLNHTSITKEQKERGITAYEMQAEQSDSTMTSEQFLETVPATFGEALYIFVPIKDRHGKHAWRAVRALFAGLDPVIQGAVLAVPYERRGDQWALYPTLGGITRFTVVQGKFPLKHDQDQEGSTMDNKKAWATIFKAIGAEATAWADKEELEGAIHELKVQVSFDESSDDSEDSDSDTPDPEMIVNHGFVEKNGVRSIKFKMKWQGFDMVKDQTWHTIQDLKDCKTLIQEYMIQEGLEAEDLIDTQVASVNAIVQDMDQGEAKGHKIALSLFDGLGGSAKLLDWIEADIDRYIAVEKEESAKVICKNVNPKTDRFPGVDHEWCSDVEEIQEADIAALGWGCIKHFSGGSPCEDFSLFRLLPPRKGCKPKGRPGIEGHTGRLFKKLIQIREWVLKYNPECEWFIENIPFKDLTTSWNYVCERLGEPLILDAADYSYTRRLRCYWTNYATPPDMITLTAGYGPKYNASDCMEEGRTVEPYFIDGKRTVRVIGRSWKQSRTGPYADTAKPVWVDDIKYRKRQHLKVQEVERLLGHRTNSTGGNGATELQRLKALGGSWDMPTTQMLYRFSKLASTERRGSLVCDVLPEDDSKTDKEEDEQQYLTSPIETEETETKKPIYKFAHMIDYDLRNRVQDKVESMLSEANRLTDNKIKVTVDELMQECDKDFQTAWEVMMTSLDLHDERTGAGAEEIPLEEWLGEDLYDEGLEADKREMDLAHRLRLRDAKPEELEGYSDEQLKRCLEMRMCHTRKRPTQDQLIDRVLGSLKSRFVAKDLKIWNKESVANTHAEVPGMIAFKLVLARANLKIRKQSSTDYDVAFMQAFTFEDLGMDEIVVRWWDYRKKIWKYGFLEGPTYGQQICMRIWKITHGEHLERLGFREVQNQKAVYYHSKLDIVCLCHVDDPWFDIGLGEDNQYLLENQEKNQEKIDQVLEIKEDELHAAISDRFKNKGKRQLKKGVLPLDYLSQVVYTEDNETIEVSMDDYRLKVLEVFDMIECKPVSTPITKELLREVTADIEAGNFMDKEQTRNYQKAVGMCG